MPTKGWAGLTKDDNYQALAIAKVMKQFTDEGIEVWLRFAHEIKCVAVHSLASCFAQSSPR